MTLGLKPQPQTRPALLIDRSRMPAVIPEQANRVARQVLLHLPALVRGQSIPDQNRVLSLQMLLQIAQESDQPRGPWIWIVAPTGRSGGSARWFEKKPSSMRFTHRSK